MLDDYTIQCPPDVNSNPDIVAVKLISMETTGIMAPKLEVTGGYARFVLTGTAKSGDVPPLPTIADDFHSELHKYINQNMRAKLF